jgi:NAD(P)-dependent dehydrogenase (short-subunit alcohol dehydrogenase family)
MARPPRDLSGKVVVITGGGRGIGRALAEALVSEGARVIIGDLDLPVAERTAEEIGGGTLALGLDVTDRAAYTAFLDEVERRAGPIDVLVNNAGIMPVTGLLDEDDAMAIRQIEINLHAVIHGTKEAMRRMSPRGTGHIVNMASVAGRVGYPHLATYSACKHGVVGLSEAVHGELRGSGVKVTVVMPALVATELATGVKSARGFRISTPEEVAAAVLDALREPRFEVYVPRSIAPTLALAGLLPRRARDAIARLIGNDVLLVRADRDARAAYEARAAASAPGAQAAVQETAAEREPRAPAP